MNHLLIDFDSKIPNFALMKISAWANRRQLYKSMDFPEYDSHFRRGGKEK